MSQQAIAPSIRKDAEDADDDLNRQAEGVKTLIAKLREVLNRDDAKNWEQVYQIRDLTEQVQRFKRQLRDSLPIGDPDNVSQDAMSALEVAQEKMAEALRAKILQLEVELGNLTEALRKERSKSWDLTYQCQDLREEVWRLTMHLSHSMTISDWEEGPLVPKTARERALEEKVRGLEKRVTELDDKAKNRDLRIGYIDGTGRARSRSM
ncbi:hypothetical protein F5144DRAFT_163306 [Chaetomium tenue]|uniref:Uncharacterized protein n=1 Tax=Chaetomium tenue TaxID=1854479 RepID=A0ACB7PB07_9PEZI|nr:hypothetical protein F5144DRAFT_163306 [Chaetomium globosum]